jgi:uncharacterized protein YndB with AHSA1/START domain
MADIKHAIPISAVPEQVYALVATAKGFSQWWAEDVVESGGAVDLGFFKRSTVYRLKLNVDKLPVHAEWVCDSGDEWKATHLIFRLEAANSGTLLRFTHAGWKGETDYFVACTTTWGELMYRLKAVAEGKRPGPLFRMAEMAY